MPPPRRRGPPRSSSRPSGRRGPTPRRRTPVVPAPPEPTGLRAAVERRSAVLLVFLSRQPKLLLPLLSAALLIGGLALPTAYGVPLLLVLAVLVGWLSYLSWRVVPTAARVLRVVTMGLLLAAVVGRLLG